MKSGKIIRWIDDCLPIFTLLNHELNEYPKIIGT